MTGGSWFLAADASGARALLEHAGTTEGSTTEVSLLLLLTPEADAGALCEELGVAAVRTLALGGAAGARHELTEALEALLAEVAPAEVTLAAPGADDPADTRAAAAGFAACLAARGGDDVTVVQEGEPARRVAADWGALSTALIPGRPAGWPATTAVLSTWNKCEDLRANLIGLRAQSVPFESVVVVDNCSGDGTAELVASEFPEVRLIVMPNSAYGACETFNIGFASATTELIAILDDDVVLPPQWVERTTARLLEEPSTTAVVSTKIVEPGMPEGYRTSEALNTERYMSTFRGCASLARNEAIRKAGYYDERLFIYGNERDLTCRLLNLGYRVLQYPGVETFHKTPFGVKMGKRSLYYHARNAFIGMIKYAPLGDLLRLPFLAVTRVLFRGRQKEVGGEITDATGTIGIGKSVRETPGAWWVLVRAGFSVLYNIPYCLARREPVRAEDFELPIE